MFFVSMWATRAPEVLHIPLHGTVALRAIFDLPALLVVPSAHHRPGTLCMALCHKCDCKMILCPSRQPHS